jgi:hypothetical protein
MKWFVSTLVFISFLGLYAFTWEQAPPYERLSSFIKTNILEFKEFRPKKIKGLQLDGFEIAYAFGLKGNKCVVGYETPNESNDEGFGECVLLLNAQNQVLFKSKGSGDLYLYEPHFFRSKRSSKIFLVCQSGFEYYCGADVFEYHNGRMSKIGYLNIEGTNPEVPLVGILQIYEVNERIYFSVTSDSLIIDPGGETEHITNASGIRYEYERGELVLKGKGL